MSGFTVDWLALREPADAAARSLAITRIAVEALPPGLVKAVDLATGTGSNVRYLAPQLPPQQDWWLVDSDDRLLARVPERMRDRGVSADVRFQTRHVDLSASNPGAVIDGRDLVTAAALLDLVSERWLASFADRCRSAGAVVLFALTYSGRMDFSPHEEADEEIRTLVNRHQRTDKGFGPALGPDAPARAEALLADRGYRVTRAPSDWVLGPDQRELQQQLIDGWAAAASEIEPTASERAADWRWRRLAHVAAGRSNVVVGHDDLAAV
jgi:hypothetical protein